MVEPDGAPKSMGAEETFGQDTHDVDLLRATLREQSERVARELRAESYAGRTVTLKLRFADFSTITRAHSGDPTQDGLSIFRSVDALFSRVRLAQAVRLIGVSVSGLGPAGSGQLSLLEPDALRRERLARAVDRLASRFGDKAVRPASTMGKRRRGRSEPSAGKTVDFAGGDSYTRPTFQPFTRLPARHALRVSRRFAEMKLRVLAALLLVAFPAVTNAQSRVPGVTDTEIVIGLTAPLSGPAAIYGNLAFAKEAWARYVNDSGGVHGRKLKVVLKDDGFSPTRAVANLREMKDSVFLTAGLVGSAVVNAAKDEIAEARLPLVNAYASPQTWARQPRDKLRYVFIDYPDYADEADYLVTYSVTKLGARSWRCSTRTTTGARRSWTA